MNLLQYSLSMEPLQLPMFDQFYIVNLNLNLTVVLSVRDFVASPKDYVSFVNTIIQKIIEQKPIPFILAMG